MDQEFDDATKGGDAICQRCGHDTREDLPEVSEDDKQEYIRCVLGRRPFTKELTFLQESVTLTLSDMTLGDRVQSDALLRSMASDGKLAEEPQGLILLAMAMRGLSVKGEVPRVWPGTPKTGDELWERLDAMQGTFPSSLAPALSSAYVLFQNTLVALAERALDRNF